MRRRLRHFRPSFTRDLSYNHITFLGNENAQFFLSQGKLFDLILSYNNIGYIADKALSGLSSLQVLDLEGNDIRLIADDAFAPLLQLRVL